MLMRPDSVPPPAPPPMAPKPENKDPYQFITDPYKPAKKGLLPKLTTGDNSKQDTLIKVVGGLVLVMIIFLLVSVLFGSKVSNKDQLIALAKEQNELIRVADVGVVKAKTIEAKNLATTAKLTLSSHQKPLIDTLAAQKVKLKPKQLVQGRNAETDKKLTAAEQTNRFDEVFIALLSTQLKTYQTNLKAAYDNTSNQQVKALLSDQYSQASFFIEGQTPK